MVPTFFFFSEKLRKNSKNKEVVKINSEKIAEHTSASVPGKEKALNAY